MSPSYHKALFITDAAINIAPDLTTKADIIQNAVDMLHALGNAAPKVAILSAVETVNPKIPGTLDAAALCKMADRGQITGAVLDGPLAFDNAISRAAAAIKKIVSPVAGDADILVAPDLEAGQHDRQAAQLPRRGRQRRHRPRRPRALILTSRADSVTSRLASVALARLLSAAARREARRMSDAAERRRRGECRLLLAEILAVRWRPLLPRRPGGRHRRPAGLPGEGCLRRRGRGPRPVLAGPEEPGRGADGCCCPGCAIGSTDGRWRGSGTAWSMAAPTHDRPERVTPALLEELERLSPLAPLHQPHNLAPIRAALEKAPGLPQVACFDTAFHRTMPEVVQAYAIPIALAEKGIRRYGFHGLSYEYIASALPKAAPAIAEGRVVVAHLGNGASLCGMQAGRSVATTMGFSALDGLPMGTRCGELDPAVVLHLLQPGGHDRRRGGGPALPPIRHARPVRHLLRLPRIAGEPASRARASPSRSSSIASRAASARSPRRSAAWMAWSSPPASARTRHRCGP